MQRYAIDLSGFQGVFVFKRIISMYFGTSDKVWPNLKTIYDLEVEKDRLGKRLVNEVGVYRQVHQ